MLHSTGQSKATSRKKSHDAGQRVKLKNLFYGSMLLSGAGQLTPSLLMKPERTDLGGHDTDWPVVWKTSGSICTICIIVETLSEADDLFIHCPE